MSIQRLASRFSRALLAATMVLALGAGSAAAHLQTVTPNGNSDGFGPRPVSRSWAQAHCNANSPSHIAESSNGVVQFTPAGPRDCDEIPNPGGQVHPHADD